MAIISSKEFYQKSESIFNLIKRKWTSFSIEAPKKFNSLVSSGIKPSVSSSSSGNQIGISLSFNANMDAAKEYLNKMKEEIEDYQVQIFALIEDIDEKLESYVAEGIDSETFTNLSSLLLKCIDYIPSMTMDIHNAQISIETPENIQKIKTKWKNKADEKARQLEASEYGVSLADLDKHKRYLQAKKDMVNAKTSVKMQDAKNKLLALKDYLDSASLASDCNEKISVLRAKEEEEKRIAKEKEEERKRKEEEERRIAEEKKKKEISENKGIVEGIWGSFNDFKANVTEAIQTEKENLTKKNREKIEKLLNEKEELLKERKALGFFKFSEKKQKDEKIKSIDCELEVLKASDYLEGKYQKLQSNADAAIKKYENDIKNYLDKKYNLGYNPKKTKGTTVSTEYNDDVKSLILKILNDNKGKMTISQICEELESIGVPLSNQRVSAVLRSLVESYIVIRTEERRMAFFESSYSGFSKPKKQIKSEVVANLEPYVLNPAYASLSCPCMPKLSEIIQGEI
jgi:hypothetical protein